MAHAVGQARRAAQAAFGPGEFERFKRKKWVAATALAQAGRQVRALHAGQLQ